MLSMLQIETILIAVTVGVSCALIGTFLVLRRMALMSDAISHAILFGIVIAFLLYHSTASLPMIIAATATGVLTAFLVELTVRTRLVKEDAAIGLIFPILFSIGVILIARNAENVHLDTDAVLLGELAFAPFNRLILRGYDLGPQALWLAGVVCAINLAFILLFFKEFKLATFDAGLATALGFSPVLIHYTIMTLVSVTAVSSFEAVGSILVVALMIAPPAAAYMLTDRLALMLIVGPAISVIGALGGYACANAFDASISGCMTTVIGLVFMIVLFTAPRKGLLSQFLRRRRQRVQFASELQLVHLLHHEGQPSEAFESHVDHLHDHMQWAASFGGKVIEYLRKGGLVTLEAEHLKLTEDGRARARAVMLR